MTPEVRRVVFALAREALAIRDSYDKRGWVMNPLPHEAEVRAVLGGPEPPDDEPEPEWFEGADGFVRAPLSYENREGDPAFNGAFDKW